MAGNWKGRKVLITGITGFVGGALAKRLVKEGANVVGLTSSKKKIPDGDFLSKVNLYEGDVRDADLLRNIVSYNEVEYIYHLAAYAIVRNSAKDPVSTYDVNVMGTVAILEAARQFGKCKKVVTSSSDKAYGDHEELPYTEKHALLAKNTYDASKACADIIGRAYLHSYGIPVSVVRCSNIYGPGDLNTTRLIPNTIRRLQSGQAPQVFSDVDSMEREFIFIDDVVDAYLRIGETPSTENTAAFNVGGNGPLQVGFVIDRISKLMGINIPKQIIDRDFKEIQKQYIDSTQLERWTDWYPSTELDDGLKKTIKWYKKYLRNGELK